VGLPQLEDRSAPEAAGWLAAGSGQRTNPLPAGICAPQCSQSTYSDLRITERPGLVNTGN